VPSVLTLVLLNSLEMSGKLRDTNGNKERAARSGKPRVCKRQSSLRLSDLRLLLVHTAFWLALPACSKTRKHFCNKYDSNCAIYAAKPASGHDSRRSAQRLSLVSLALLFLQHAPINRTTHLLLSTSSAVFASYIGFAPI
jgi:hypothetical protein